MDDLEKFTETVRSIEKGKLLSKRHRSAQVFRRSLSLPGEIDFQPQVSLKGMTVSEALQALCSLDADNQINKAVTKTMDKIAKRLLEGVTDET